MFFISISPMDSLSGERDWVRGRKCNHSLSHTHSSSNRISFSQSVYIIFYIVHISCIHSSDYMPLIAFSVCLCVCASACLHARYVCLCLYLPLLWKHKNKGEKQMLNELIYSASPWLLTQRVLADAKGSASDPPSSNPHLHPLNTPRLRPCH